MPVISIVLPTHRRAAILRTCLERIAAQTIAAECETIVVSDGKDEATSALFAGNRDGLPDRLTFLEIPKSHQGVARNRGVERATGDIVLFVQDDIFLERNACERHLAAHRSFAHRTPDAPTEEDSRLPSHVSRLPAVLGYTAWDPSLDITPVMRWLDATGWQFGYRFLAPYAHRAVPRDIQHRFTYASHISLPREIAARFPFREDVTQYGWEDVEWGWRLREAGVPLVYEPDARGLHHHRLTLEDSLRRMETLGRAARFFDRVQPQLRLTPTGAKRVAYQIRALIPTMQGLHARAFLRGMAEPG